MVAIFYASFDGAINQLSDDVVPGSNTVRFLIFNAAIVLPAPTVIIATKGRLGRAKEAVDIHAGVSEYKPMTEGIGNRPNPLCDSHPASGGPCSRASAEPCRRGLLLMFGHRG